MTYIKELDVIRFFAFILVFVSHYFYFWRDKDELTRWFTQGDVGVHIFFVLSGFLITSLLLIEKQKTGSINLKNFYWRRVLRIWPLYFLIVFIGVVLAILQSQWAHVHLLSLFTFTSNFALMWDDDFYLPLAILWSISLEEQFYLVWAPMVMYIKENYLKVILFVATAISIWFKFYGTNLWQVADYHTLSNISYLAVGCLLAYYIGNKYIEKVVAIGKKLFDYTRVAEFEFLLYLGKISYGLYMYHILALKITDSFIPAFILTIILAHISYKYFEQPIIHKYKSRFSN